MANARLAILPQDSEALAVLIDSHVMAADIELERGSRRSQERALEHCFQALACFASMHEAEQMSKDDWSSLTEVAQALLEAATAYPTSMLSRLSLPTGDAKFSNGRTAPSSRECRP